MRQLVAAMSLVSLLLLTRGPLDSSAQALLDCDYFNFQEQAQAILDEDLSDPNLLDDDGDGVACPDLPSAGPDPDFPELPANGDYRCVDFAYQEMAQVILDEDPSDPSNLDPTGDGLACSRLPLQADNESGGGLADDALADDADANDRRADRRAARDDTAADDAALEEEAAADDRAARRAARDDAAADAPADDVADDTAATEDDREARRAARQAEREAEGQ